MLDPMLPLQRGWLTVLLGGLGLALACDRTPEPPSARAAPRALEAPAAAPSPIPAATRHPGGARMIAIGDLHGDLAATHAALELGGAIDATGHWAGGKLVVVQTGDELDRGDGERAIIDLFERLAEEAKLAGGAVIALNGNHEVMNVQGDFRYVTPSGFRQFQGVTPAAPGAAHTSLAERERASAFLPGGGYAKKLANRDVIAIVKDTVFAHGGVLYSHVRYGIDRMNQETRAWMAGTGPLPAAVIAGEDTPIWTRVYSLDEPSAAACRELDRVLAALSVKRMVVGHTVQRRGINSACNDKVYRIDVGMSRYYGGDSIQVLELTDSGAKVLRGQREALLEKPEERR